MTIGQYVHDIILSPVMMAVDNTGLTGFPSIVLFIVTLLIYILILFSSLLSLLLFVTCVIFGKENVRSAIINTRFLETASLLFKSINRDYALFLAYALFSFIFVMNKDVITFSDSIMIISSTILFIIIGCYRHLFIIKTDVSFVYASIPQFMSHLFFFIIISLSFYNVAFPGYGFSHFSNRHSWASVLFLYFPSICAITIKAAYEKIYIGIIKNVS